MSNLRHHPKSDTLAAFAAGQLDEARAVVIATHAAQCPDCAKAISDFEALYGVMLEDAEPVPMADDALEKILARTEGRASVILPTEPASSRAPDRSPLDPYLKGSLDDVDWKWVAPGVHQHVMKAEGYRPGVLRLVKFDPGKGVPPHSHKGEELTLILRGAYRDSIGEFKAGDLADLDGGDTHEPIAFGDEPCICLIATSAPLEFKTLLGKAVQPFVGL